MIQTIGLLPEKSTAASQQLATGQDMTPTGVNASHVQRQAAVTASRKGADGSADAGRASKLKNTSSITSAQTGWAALRERGGGLCQEEQSMEQSMGRAMRGL